MKKVFLVALLFAASVVAAEFGIDKSHSRVGFSIKHMGISNTQGNFKMYDAKIVYDEKTKEFKGMEATIDVASVNTENETRDGHLMGADFFDAKQFPKITFMMNSFDKKKGIIMGVLTMKGVSRDVKLEVEDVATMKAKDGSLKIGFNMETKINRKDFGIAKDKPSAMLGEMVKISIDIEASAK